MSEERVPYIAGPQKPEEARIYIEYFKDDPCKNCDVAEAGYCVDEDKGHGCLDKSNYIYGMTRTEAIEKMAKAICRRENLLDSCSHCMFYYKKQNGEMCKEILTKREDDMEPSYIDIAEAALDALLEKGK